MVIRWSWLGDHLALDFANTVRRRGMRYTELITGPGALTEWLAHQHGRLSAPAPVDEELTARFRTARDPALRVLRAAAAGQPLPGAEVAAVNTALLAAPPIRVLDLAPGPPRIVRTGRVDPATQLLSDTAAAVVDLLTTPIRTDLTLCDAPGCGQLYLRARPNQQWCNPHCGTRARGQRLTDRRAGP